MGRTVTVADLPDLDDAELDRIYAYLLGQHREGIGPTKANAHAMIMAVLAEWSRRIDAWLEALPPVAVLARQAAS